jgi:gliding motility associated protien GldN
MKRIIVLALTLSSTLILSSQSVNYEDFEPISGEQNPYEKRAVEERPVVQHVYLQEVDMKYQKKIHRDIDTRQKMNRILTWPKNPLSQWIHQFAIDGKVKAYTNDSLFAWMHPEDAKKRGGREYTLQVPNPFGDPDDPFDTIDTLIVEEFEHYKIVKYRLLEDWYFDHKHSVFKPRIMAIAPLFMLEFGGVEIGEQPMFWLRYDELRPLLKNLELFNNENDAARLSYDHFFEYRLFDSYIVKQSNMYDLYINEMDEFKDDNMAALLQSEEIKNDLFIWEHDLWEY